jgi:hypothetical protein
MEFWVFPLCTLVFALQLIMVDPHLATSDSITQKAVTFLMILA